MCPQASGEKHQWAPIPVQVAFMTEKEFTRWSGNLAYQRFLARQPHK
jgi:hypothetical protein